VDHSETLQIETRPQAGRKRPLDIEDACTETDKAFRSGTLDRMSSATLRIHLLTLANQPAKEVQQRDVIRSMMLNQLLLQRQIERMNRQSSGYRWFAAALALASLLGSVTAILLALAREPASVPAPQPTVQQKDTQSGGQL